MGEYTTEYMSKHFAVGNVADYGPAWWALREDHRALHFDGSVPLSVAEDLIGWQAVQVPMLYTDITTGLVRPYGRTDDDGNYTGPMVVQRSDTGEPVGKNDGKSGLINYWEWFVHGPKTLLDTSELNLGGVFVFHGGRQAAVQIDLAKVIVDSATGVDFRPFLYAAASFDQSISPQYGRGFTRMVCDNTFRMGQMEAMRSGHFYKIKQTKNSAERVDYAAARAALDIIWADAEEIKRETQELCATAVTDPQWDRFLDLWVPRTDAKGADLAGRSKTMADNKRDALGDLWNNDTRVAPWRNTAFGVSQAVTTYGQHLSIVRNVSRLERQKLTMINGQTATEERDALDKLRLVLAA